MILRRRVPFSTQPTSTNNVLVHSDLIVAFSALGPWKTGTAVSPTGFRPGNSRYNSGNYYKSNVFGLDYIVQGETYDDIFANAYPSTNGSGNNRAGSTYFAYVYWVYDALSGTTFNVLGPANNGATPSVEITPAGNIRVGGGSGGAAMTDTGAVLPGTGFYHIAIESEYSGADSNIRVFINGRKAGEIPLIFLYVTDNTNIETRGYGGPLTNITKGISFIAGILNGPRWGRYISENVWKIFSQYEYTFIGAAVTVNTLIAGNSNQATLSSSNLVTQNHTIFSANALETGTVSPVAITQRQILVTANANSTATASALSIVQNYLLNSLNSTSSNTASTGVVTQNHVLVPSTATNLASSGVGSVFQTQILVAGNSSSSNLSTGNTLTQVQFILASSNSQANSSINVSLNAGFNTLVGSPSSQASSSSGNILFQIHGLVGTNSSESNTSSNTTVSQVHSILSSNSTETNASSNVLVIQAHGLIGTNANSLNTSSANAVYQNQLLIGSSLTQSSNVSIATISQRHIVSATSSIQIALSLSVNIAMAYSLTVGSCTQNSTSVLYVPKLIYGKFIRVEAPTRYFYRTISVSNFIGTNSTKYFV